MTYSEYEQDEQSYMKMHQLLLDLLIYSDMQSGKDKTGTATMIND